MSTTRPYLNFRLTELQQLLRDQPRNLSNLRALAAELEYRNTRGADELLVEVTRLIAEITGNRTQAPQHRLFEAGLPIHIEPSKSSTAPRTALGTSRPTGDLLPDLDPIDPLLRKPSVRTLVQPLGTPGRPRKYVPRPQTDVTINIPGDASPAQRYSAALEALISDMRRLRQGSRQIPLDEGRRVRLDTRHLGYAFPFTEEAELFEDARVELRVAGANVEATVVSLTGGQLIVAVEQDLGDRPTNCTLIIDNTALLAALKDRLDKIEAETPPFNTEMANSIVAGTSTATPVSTTLPWLGASNLNARQVAAVKHALDHRALYLWGPPGTGKTTTLAELLRHLLQGEKRILICSNTNRAVDQILLKLCSHLGKAHPAVEQGKIVRLGRIALDELNREFAEFVTVDGIVERKSRDLQSKKAKIESDLEKLAQEVARAENTLDKLARLEACTKAVASAEATINKYRQSVLDAARRQQLAQQSATRLENELNRRITAGAFRRVFMRTEASVKADLVKVAAELRTIDEATQRDKSALDAAERNRREVTNQARALRSETGGIDRAIVEKALKNTNDLIQPKRDELAQINKALADIAASVVKDAFVIGATVTKTFLSSKTLGTFDAVIVDEASMVLLPALYFVAGLAKERIVISGDFRQLPPIVQTRQKAILDIIGMDVFEAAGIADASTSGGNPNLVMLDEQHRMHDAICDLISGPMYQGKLRTAAARRAAEPDKAGPLTIVDTSSLWPFETQTTTLSRYNLVHALVVRNLLLKFRDDGQLSSGADAGVCTPYAAQAKLTRKLIEDVQLHDLVEAATVHRYQGDEKKTIILDLPDSIGGARSLGRFLQGDNPGDDGAKLLNVAISRARDQLVIVANLTYLDEHLPSGAILRDVLYRMQTNGRLVDAQELLELRASDLVGLDATATLGTDTHRKGLFGQGEFDIAFRADVGAAKQSVVVFSGFITPERVGAYGDLFRRKVLEGVRIRCVTRPPQSNGTIPAHEGKAALDALESVGVVVDCRKQIHQKIVMIDRETVWFGSLNPLSFTTRTDETMIRLHAPAFALELEQQVAIRKLRRTEDGSSITVGENPRCGSCGGRTFYSRSPKGGGFFGCEGDCQWTQDAFKPSRAVPIVTPEGTPSCPVCGQPMRRRTGRFGSFFGCIDYPKCKGTVDASDQQSSRKVRNSKTSR